MGYSYAIDESQQPVKTGVLWAMTCCRPPLIHGHHTEVETVKASFQQDGGKTHFTGIYGCGIQLVHRTSRFEKTMPPWSSDLSPSLHQR